MQSLTLIPKVQKCVYTRHVRVTFWQSDTFRHPMGTDIDLRREARALLQNTTLYREFQAEKEEILKHKWIESEKLGFDIGFERALVDWITHHRAGWRRARHSAAGMN